MIVDEANKQIKVYAEVNDKFKKRKHNARYRSKIW